MSIVLAAGQASSKDVEPTYLYKLSPGIVTSSHALGCAALFGVPIQVQLRGQRVSELLSKHEILELVDVEMSEEEVEELDQVEEIVRRFLRTDFEDGPRWEDEGNEVITYLKDDVLRL